MKHSTLQNQTYDEDDFKDVLYNLTKWCKKYLSKSW